MGQNRCHSCSGTSVAPDTIRYLSQHTQRKTAIRTLSYQVPEALKNHIDLVQPTTMFGLEPLTLRVSTRNRNRRDDPGVDENKSFTGDCREDVTPRCLMALYKMKNVCPDDKNKTSIGIAGFLNEYGNRAHLQTFLERFQPDLVGRNYTTILVNGGHDDQSKPGGEANLNIQYIAGLTTPDVVTFYSVGGSPPFQPDLYTPTNTNEPYEELLEYLLDPDQTTKIPEVITISYGDKEQTVPKSYAERVCNQFAQLGARGTTVLVSSGNDGVGDSSLDPFDHICFPNDGKNTTRFQPEFPASCPFVTTVGATVGTSPERGVLFSGGGFSEYFKQPAWQSDKVQSYLNAASKTYEGLYNPEGRAYPDVAAQGVGFKDIFKSLPNIDSGTSASAPVFAAVVWHINNARLSRGKPPLGF